MRRILLGFTMLALLTGCASMLPTQMIDGVAVYIRDAATVDAYCRAHTAADQSIPGRQMGGCYVRQDRTIMVAAGPRQAAVLAHELRHAGGENHRGACSAVADNPDGLKPDGTPCEWYR
jgi:hypothetical protein